MRALVLAILLAAGCGSGASTDTDADTDTDTDADGDCSEEDVHDDGTCPDGWERCSLAHSRTCYLVGWCEACCAGLCM